jgi:hypothetical protein
VYGNDLLGHAGDAGSAASGAGGIDAPGAGGSASMTGESGGAAGTIASMGGSAGIAMNPAGGAGGADDATSSGGAAGVGGNAGSAAADGGASDLSLFRDGVFFPGWGTIGSWNTCNGTPTTATVSATAALAVDLSCNSFNGALIINWSAPLPSCTYATLSFDIYFASVADISTLQVYLQDSKGRTGLLLSVSSLLAAPQDKAFNHVSLPLTDFGVGLVFNGIGFFNMSTGGIPLFYLNDVVLGAGTGACSDGGA